MATIAGSGSLVTAAALAVAVLVAAFVVWPWAVLPTSIVLGAAGSVVLGVTSVSSIVVLHAVMLGAGMLALVLRMLIGRAPERRRTAADAPMLGLGSLAALIFLYGMARGNAPYLATVAAYQVAVIPVYYWIATATLGEQTARRRAGMLFVAGTGVMAAVGLGTPGRHGGLLSAIALVLVLSAAASHPRPQTRFLLVACAALFLVDVALGAYRAVWLATAIALVMMTVRGQRAVRVGIVVALALALAVGAAAFSLSSAIPSRLAVAEAQLGATAGYRLPEAAVGLQTFASAPLLGRGFGETTPMVYLPEFRTDDVGPVYHVFYVTVLANGGALLLLALFAALLPALRLLVARHAGASLPWGALLLGFLAAAAFAGPTDGHWELGLLPALALMECPRPARVQRRRTAAGESRAERPPVTRTASVRAGTDTSTASHVGGSRDPGVEPAWASARRSAGILAVVVTYQSRDGIEECLSALTESVERIVVVDNASSDGTAAFVRHRFPGVEVIANPDNVGFAKAVNQGVAGAEQDTVMIVNPDCVLASGTARVMRDHLRAHPDVGIVAPRLLDSSGSPVVSVHRFETLLSVLASRFGGSLLSPRLRLALSRGTAGATQLAGDGGEGPVLVDWASGACLAVRGELLERLGGLDDGYFMYYEDEELCLQAHREGAQVAYLPAVNARHVGGASSSDPAAVWPVLYTSMLRFFTRHRPRSVPALRAALVLRACIGVALATKRRRRRAALAWWNIARVALRPLAGPDTARP
jgi:GT2 family glycosyltransferase/O-antigen ligase